MKTTSGSKDWTNDKAPDAQKGTEENSVTFSLSALMAQGNQEKDKGKAAATKDDSGLIDLNALAAMEDTARKSPIPQHIGLFPFDAPPIAAAPVEVAPPPADITPPKPKRGLVWIGAGVAVALAAAAFMFGMQGGAGGPQAVASAPVTLETTPRAPLANDPAKAPDPDKLAAADPGAPKDKEPPKTASSAKAPPAAPLHGKLAKADTTDKKTAPPPAAEEKKAAPSDPCHGDLMCAMQRAAAHK